MVLVIFFFLPSYVPTVKAEMGNQTLAERLETDRGEEEILQKLPYYSEISKEYGQFPKGVHLSVASTEYTEVQGESPQLTESGTGVVMDEKTNAITWTVTVPEKGFYHIEVAYATIDGAIASPQREIFINGKQTFYEQGVLSFERRWKDDSAPLVNNLGDEVRAPQSEIKEPIVKLLYDQWGKQSEPLLFPFEPGENTITLRYISQPLIIYGLAVVSYQTIPSYAQAYSLYEATSATQTLRFEAEDVEFVKYRSDATVSIANSGDPMTSPFSAVNTRLNVMGGSSYSKGGQEICWEFVVPETGLYQINLRMVQNYTDGLPVYRTIKINGQVPFRELLQYAIPYDKKWNSTVLCDDKQQPYLFELKEGVNTLSLTVTLGNEATIVAETLLGASEKLSEIVFDITRITGQNPDVNYDYQLDLEIPTLLTRFEEIRDMTIKSREILLSISDKSSAVTNNLQRIAKELDELIEKPSKIPRRLSDISNNLINLSSYADSVQYMPLAIDYIELLPPTMQPDNPHSTFWQRAWVTLRNFVASFFKDYNLVASLQGGEAITKEPLEVWVSRGREWSQVLKEMTDVSFTPTTGIPVNIKLLPSGSVTASANPLLLAIGAGRGPDVVMGLAYNTPVEYAMRDALLDLSKMDGYEDVAQRFIPETLIPLTFEGGVYALPETMSFKAMYVRTDIFASLGIAIPNTWEEVYNQMLPALSQNNLQMYVPALIDIFLYQHGGEYYTPDMLTSGLDSPQAISAFTELCRLYTHNGLPISTDFYSRFRTGEMPIGLDYHTAYLQFSFAAPEIAGRWQVFPVPGRKKDDGTIDRSNSGLSVDAACILSDCHNSEDAWFFLKWWTSDSTQTAYATQTEGRLGSAARWMSSNKNAYTALPWSVEDRVAIQTAWDWAREAPVVRGGYYTNRHLVNAISRVVVGNVSPRIALEEAVEQINKELVRKRRAR